MKLQAAREAEGLTQKQVAMQANITEAAYQNYEYGKRKPCVDIAIRIADTLNVQDLRQLFAATDDGINSTAK